MKPVLMVWIVALGAIVTSCREPAHVDSEVATAPAAGGTVSGHVRVTGAVPPNDVIRMNADPMCRKATGGQHVTDEAVIAAPDGSLANVFVEVVGTFPETPVPTEPVLIDQRACMYSPRVVGVRAGQVLQVRNSDDGLHNVHGVSTDRDSFNVSQPISGMVTTFHPRDAGILRLKCDVHTWMVAFVGVVDHPYFAVTHADGAFTLRDVPEGMYELRAWHEQLGTISTHVRVDASHEANVEMSYSGKAPSTP
jgi:plastocyanin